jgi:peptidoglycan/LPS O-acetylase OafA/YrhL
VNAPRDHLAALTGVRFVAAILVVCFHVRQLSVQGASEWAQAVVNHGQVGVTLFFVLSGFILTYTNHREDAAGSSPATRTAFWRARFARIYPVYLLGLLVSFPLFLREVAHGGVSRTDVGAALLTPVMLQAWLPQTACSAWNCPGWSISAEAFFYALFPFALPVLARFTRRGHVTVLTGLWVLALAFPVTLLAVAQNTRVPDMWYEVAYYHPLARLPEFLVGVTLGLAYLRRRVNDRHGVLLGLAGFAGVLAVLRYGDVLGSAMLRNAVAVVPVSLLVLGLASGRGPLARLLGSRPLVVLGEASYSLYILHLPVYLWVFDVQYRVAPDLGVGRAFFWVVFAVLVVLSVLTYRLVERPAQRALRARRASRAETESALS